MQTDPAVGPHPMEGDGARFEHLHEKGARHVKEVGGLLSCEFHLERRDGHRVANRQLMGGRSQESKDGGGEADLLAIHLQKTRRVLWGAGEQCIQDAYRLDLRL